VIVEGEIAENVNRAISSGLGVIPYSRDEIVSKTKAP
jgi:hypothetical protein